MAFSHIARDSRVLRQIEYLSHYYKITVVGYGEPHLDWTNNEQIEWVRLPDTVNVKDVLGSVRKGTLTNALSQIQQVLKRAIFPVTVHLGRFSPSFYAWGYALRWRFVQELQDALNQPHDAFHANDWDTLLPMYEAAQKQNAPLVVDLHEYAPLHWDHEPDWHYKQSLIKFMLRRYATTAHVVSTVAPSLAAKYAEEFDINPIVVMNAPDFISVPQHELDPNNIRLIHHGIATEVRKPEIMIEAIALCQPRYSLHMMLIPSDHVNRLKELAEARAPGRVFFHPPVPPEKIVSYISEFDVGFNIIGPTTFNYLHSLPNKFFEGIVAGLAVCIGPSPSMMTVVDQYKVGCIAPTFDPEDIALTLNQTTAEQWTDMRNAANDAAKHLNSAKEMSKFLAVYENLFSAERLLETESR